MAAKTKKPKKGTAEASAAVLQEMAGNSDGGFSIVFGGELEDTFITPKYHFSTGVRAIDTVIGEGGFASGKISEIFGAERSGKTELVQRTNEQFLLDYPTGIAIYYDQELSIDDKKLEGSAWIGCDRLMVSVANTAEDLFNDIEKKVKHIYNNGIEVPILISLDSLAAVETKAEAAGEVGDAHVAPLARVMSAALKKIKPVLMKTNAHLMVINQVRDNIGGGPFTSNSTPGGRALKFYADYRIRVSKVGNFHYRKLKDKKPPPDGFIASFMTAKNKRVAPDREIEVPLVFRDGDWGRSGLNDCWGVFQVLQKAKAFSVGGGYYSLKGKADDGTPLKEIANFEKVEWPGIYRDPQHPLKPYIDRAFASWENNLMNSTTLDGAGAEVEE